MRGVPSRYLYFLIAIVVGLVGGLYYGWVVNPVRVVDLEPSLLREDFQADYVLMVAEIYQSEQNPNLAFQRLEFLQLDNPLLGISNAAGFAEKENFADADIENIKNLESALENWAPSPEEGEAQ